MALMDAQPYDARRARRRRMWIGGILLAILIIIFVGWELRFLPEEHAADRFFSALEHKDYDHAYALWMADADWKQHPEKYARYPFTQFYQDWGPPSEYGVISSHSVVGAANPEMGSGSGVVVTVQINHRPVTAKVWVEKKDKSLGFPP